MRMSASVFADDYRQGMAFERITWPSTNNFGWNRFLCEKKVIHTDHESDKKPFKALLQEQFADSTMEVVFTYGIHTLYT